jgi:V/A-type H+/Na+-transporting ATPase subunit D
MDPNTVPTKGNLIKIKNSLALAIQGYELMDKKRNILIRELLELVEKAKNIQSEIDVTFSEAYLALQKANIEMGIRNVEDLSSTVPEENSIAIKQRSIMGTDIPLVEFNESDYKPAYSFYDTRISLDEATNRFKKVKELTLRLAMIENSAYRLATNIKKTQKRANALKNITIPYYTQLVHDIQNSLEEREREEFTRLKVIKRRQNSAS